MDGATKPDAGSFRQPTRRSCTARWSSTMRGSSGVAGVANGDCEFVRFSTTDYPPHKRLDACREIYGRTLSKRDIEPLSTEQFHTEATLRRMPGLGLGPAPTSAGIYCLRRRLTLPQHSALAAA